jgi:hypothetical protein
MVGSVPARALRSAGTDLEPVRTGIQSGNSAEFVNFFLNGPEVVKILGVARGVPMAKASRDVLLPILNELDRRTVE